GGRAVAASQLRRGKCVAVRDFARLQSGIEPALALLRAAMSKTIRHHVALRALLQRVIADRRRGAHRRFYVAGLDKWQFALALEHLVLAVRPHAGKAVCL